MTAGDPRTAREGTIPGAGVLGMWVFLAAIAGYLVVRLDAAQWPPPGMPRLPKGMWAATVLLLAGSVTVHKALRAIRTGERTASQRWLGLTLAIGVAFLAVQSFNWWRLVAAHTSTKNLYAFTFFMLTGLHAAHVVGGLVLLGIVAARAARGRYGSGQHAGFTYAAMYWHFLDAIWIVVFGVLLVFA